MVIALFFNVKEGLKSKLSNLIYKIKFSISWTDFIVLAPGNSNYLKLTALTS